MKVKTIAGMTYGVSAAGACTVTAVTDEGTSITLCSIDNGGQKAFQAIGGEVEVSDSTAVVVPFADASVPIGEGEGGGISAGTLEEVVRGEIADAMYDSEGESEAQFSVENGASLSYKYAVLDARRVPGGRVTAVTLRCRTSAFTGVGESPVYLAVFSNEETPVLLGVSTDAHVQTVNGYDTWHFERLLLNRRAVRLVALTAPADAKGLDWAALTLVLGGMVAENTEGDVSECVSGTTHVRKPLVGSFTVARALVNGEDGAPGEPGKSALQIWNEAGNDGGAEEFLASLKGERGERGEKGEPGEPDEEAMRAEVAAKVKEAVMKDGVVELTTGEGTADFNARYLQVGGRYLRAGKLRAVTLACRTGSSSEIATEGLFLGVWEKNEADDGYTRLGASSAAAAQVVGQAQTWEFEDFPVSGRPLRFALLTEAEGLWPSDWKLFGVRVFNRAADDAESKVVGKAGGDNAFVAVATVAVLAEGVVPRFAAAEHVGDAVAHLSQGEHEGLTGLLAAEPPAGLAGESKLVNEETGAYMRLGGAFVGLDAGEKYQAAMASLDKEHGAGVRLLVSREKAYYKHGAGDEPTDGDELVRKEELEAARLTGEQTEALKFVIDNKEKLLELITAAQAE